MSILWAILIGFVVGLIAKFLMPGRDPGGGSDGIYGLATHGPRSVAPVGDFGKWQSLASSRRQPLVARDRRVRSTVARKAPALRRLSAARHPD